METNIVYIVSKLQYYFLINQFIFNHLLDFFHLILTMLKINNFQFNPPFVLLANGKYPNHPNPLKILHSSNTIICTDGSAKSLRQNGMVPQVIIGDLDSLNIDENSFDGLLIRDSNQNNTDLEKALDWSIEYGIEKMSILGATGLREDHSIANLFIFAEYYSKLNLTMVTNHFTITCHTGNKIFDSYRGQTVSLFVVNPNTIITTQHLKYPMKDRCLLPSSKAISNESLNSKFSIESNKPVLVFRSHDLL